MNLSSFFIIFSWLVGGLIILYSLAFMKGKKYFSLYILCALATLAFSTAAFLADDLIKFLVFWGSLLVLLYAMLGFGSLKTASRALTIVGLGDFCLILGICLLMAITKESAMSRIGPVATNNSLTAITFLLIALGAVAKAGVFGFHNWIVEASETNPSTTMAFLPASLDKFLGIYLLVRASTEFFAVNETLSIVLMGVGAFTILLSVLMALIQHDLKKLLAYHAVSQVGYMVLGIASGTFLGLIGGLFHMLNHTLYKSTLFLGAGNIEYRVGKTELSHLGGLSKLMPVTFVTTLIASLSISGVPPFNGFVSKWMIYQGLIPDDASRLSVFKLIFLVMAMFGSALTLASFIKVLYSAFLSDRPREVDEAVTEVPFMMQIPVIVFSLLCVLFGVFAKQIILRPFFEKIYRMPITPLGAWRPDVATAFIMAGLLVGVAIYFLSKVPGRRSDIFIGGEVLKDNRIMGTDFYLTVQEAQPMKSFYGAAEAGLFDFYKKVIFLAKFFGYILYYLVDRLINLITNGIGKFVFVVSAGLKALHTGLLDRYTTWLLLGLVLILGVLFRCLNCM